MPEIEIKVSPFSPTEKIRLTRTDIEILLRLHEMNLTDLAGQIPCSKENLSRLLNGRATFPELHKKLALILEELIRKLPKNTHWQFKRVA